MKKRILSLVLIAVMLVCMIPAMSLVSYADGGYDALPADANRAHFLALVDAYGDEATIPTADVINAKLTKYLSSNKAMTSDGIANEIATSIFARFTDSVDVIVADIKSVIDADSDGAVDGSLADYKDALFNKLYYINGADGDLRVTLTNNETARIVFNKYNADAETWAQALADAGVTIDGYTGDDIKGEILSIMTANVTSADQTQASAQFTIATGYKLRAPYTLGECYTQSNLTGFKYELNSVIDTVADKMSYGTRRVANFYLNFTDVATEGEAEEFQAILDYYFAPGKGHYGYYEDLWYDDGNLIAFIDTSALNQDYYTTKRVTLADDGTTVVDLVPSHFAKYIDVYDILPVNTNINSASGNGTYHSAIKIVGGQNIGLYNLVGADIKNANSSIAVDENGYLHMYTENTSASTANGAGIYVGNLFTYDVIKNRKMVQAHFNNFSTMGSFEVWMDDGMTLTADANGHYGSFSLQANYMYSEFWGNIAATQYNYNSIFGNYIFGVMSGASQNGGSTFTTRIYYENGVANTNFAGMDSNATNPMLTLSKRVYFNQPHMFSLTLEGNIVDPAQKKAAMGFGIHGEQEKAPDRHYTYLTDQTILISNSDNVSKSYPWVSWNAMHTGYITTADKLFENIRMYSVELSDEQKARNYFADLVYKYGVNITADQIDMIVEYADANSFYNNFSEITMYDSTDATALEIIEAVNAYADEVSYIQNYRNLYQQKENLYAEVDFTAINENSIGTYTPTTTSIDSGIRYVEPEIDAFASVSNYTGLMTNNGGGRHAYVRVSDGSAAGNWFMLMGDGTTYTDEMRKAEDYVHPFLSYGEDGSVSFKSGVSGNHQIVTGFRYSNSQVKNFTNPGAGQPCYQWRSTRNAATNTGLGSANTADICNLNGTGYTVQYIYYAPGAIPGNYQNFMYSGLIVGFSGNARVFGPHQNSPYKTLSANEYPYIGVNFVGIFDGGDTYTTTANAYINAEFLVDERESAATFGQPLVLTGIGQSNGWDSASVSYYNATPTYLRIYITDLSAEEIAINNFVDICRFYGVSTEAYRNAGIAQQKLIINEFKGSQIGSVGCDSKEAVEAKIAGVLGNADSIFSFIGFQARVSKNVGIRSVYAYDTTKAESFRKATVVAYGAVVGYDSFENLTVTFNGTAINAGSNNFVADIIADEDDGFKSFEEAERLSVLPDSEETTTVFAYTVDFINGSIDRDGNVTGTDYTNKTLEDGTVAKEQLMFFRGFVVIELDGEYVYLYDDGISQNYQANGGAVSLVDICTYYTTNYPQYADNAAINHPLKDED